jgi:DNA polymerase I-like protein with 3'-5' exonuclease and polymerase domains
MSRISYALFDFKIPPKFRKDDTEGYSFIELPRHKKQGAPKVLFVLDHVPTEDLSRGLLLGGFTGDTLRSMFHIAKTTYGCQVGLDDLDWLAFNFNAFKTYGKTQEYREEAESVFKDRLCSAIVQYKPDIVITFGPKPFSSLNADKLTWAKGNSNNFLGTLLDTKVKYKNKIHRFKTVPTLSLNTLLGGKDQLNLGVSSYILGYMTRNLITGLEGKMRYVIPKLYKKIGNTKVSRFSVEFTDTIDKVRDCLNLMAKSNIVSIDTETDNLARIVNNVLTVQFTCDGKAAYVIPIHHKDCPFTTKEKKIVIQLLREYFETDNKNTIQIYVNGKFDLNVMRTNFKIRYYKSDVWDLIAGEYILDENMKIMPVLTGNGYYSLGNMAMQYGCGAFLDSAFGKENRATIKDTDLTEPLLHYCSLDVIIPFHIYKQQLARARDENLNKYHSMVANQLSDQIHVFSVLECTGALADIEYLFRLKLPDSPINDELEKAERKLYHSESVKKANHILGDTNALPKEGLFGKIEPQIFDLGKSEHKQVLFFDVLGLKILKKSKNKRPNGEFGGSIGKQFQQSYKDVSEVKLYDAVTKIKKLRDAYVKSLIKLWGTDNDLKTDRRIRPTYNYSTVVTGRPSAEKPNLQQIPSRSELGKHIKRLFIAGEGGLLIKVDYSAHEVRGWSIIAGDSKVAEVFQVGTDLRERYKMFPDPLIKRKIELEGDVHKINAAYFFGVSISAVTKELRNALKTVIFGLIYGQGDEGLALATRNTVAKIVQLKVKFLKRFPVGTNWFSLVHRKAKKLFYSESPLGRRRHLWGLALPKSIPRLSVVAARCLRQAVNSVVQGFSSDVMMMGIRKIDTLKYDHFLSTGHYPDMKLCVSVHDSLTVEVAYEDFWLALDFIDRGLTSLVRDEVEKRHGFSFVSNPEVDFEIGPTERDLKGWDFSFEQMKSHVSDCLDFQNSEFDYGIDEEDVMATIFEEQYDTMPDFMKKQLWSTDTSIKSKGKDIRTGLEKNLTKKWKKELPSNILKYKKSERQDRERKKSEEIEKRRKEASA